MKIIRNDTEVEMSMEDFLQMLEHDRIEEIIQAISEIDIAFSEEGSDLEQVFLSDNDIISAIEEGAAANQAQKDPYEQMVEDIILESLMDVLDGEDDLRLSDEDKRVRNAVESFRDVFAG